MEFPASNPAEDDASRAPEPRQRGVAVALRALGLPQLARIGACAAAIGVLELAGRGADVFRSEAHGRDARRARRQREVGRIVSTLSALKGVWVKAGQFAAMRHDLLPPGALEALASLRSGVRPLPFARIRRVVEAELGGPLESCYGAFEAEPLGAASLAQVHRARLHSGEEVVVKVQYPWLQASLARDLALIRGFVRFATRRAPDANWQRVYAEFANVVTSELDFRDEARNAREIAHNLAREPRIVVPRPIASHTTRRVLTMTWHPALPLEDPEALRAASVDARSVLEVIVRAYAKQVLADGFFHADPHPGNLFVIDEADAATQPRVLFIDFGLSRRLDPGLRNEMRLGLYALLQRDVDAFVDGMDRMGLIAAGARPAVHEAVRAMFARIVETAALQGGSGARILALKDEAKALLQETAGVQLPMDLLFYAKTVSYIFALGVELAPDVDVMKLSLPSLLQFLAQKESPAAAVATGTEPF